MKTIPQTRAVREFTDRMLRAIKPRGREYELNERGGFGVRVSPKGKITFQFRYRINRKKQRLALGSYSGKTLKEARAAWQAATKLVEKGLDPIKEERAQRRARELSEAAERQHETVGELADEFMARYVNVERERPDHVKQMLYGSDRNKLGILKDIGHIKAKDIKRRDLVKALDKIVDRGARVQANRTASVLKQMFQYAVERGVIDANPAADIRRRTVGGMERPRERHLSQDEIRQLWQRLEGNPSTPKPAWVGAPMAKALKLLLLTGQRKGELLRARWDHIDFAGATWTIPAEHAKNRRKHIVPLSRLALQIFRELRALAGHSQYVLPSREGIPDRASRRNPQLPRGKSRKDKPITERALTRAAARMQSIVGIDKWLPHDLRRTVATQLAELGVLPHVVEKVLNHTMSGVMAVYNKYDYAAEQRRALDSWAKKLNKIVEGAC
jgi:integrase